MPPYPTQKPPRLVRDFPGQVAVVSGWVRESLTTCFANKTTRFSWFVFFVLFFAKSGFAYLHSCQTGYGQMSHSGVKCSWYVFVKVTYIEHNWQYIHDLRVFVFEMFLKSSMQLQSTRSRRLLNGFWSFLMQKKVESLLALFLLFPVHFCWCESNENIKWSKMLCVFLVQIPKM